MDRCPYCHQPWENRLRCRRCGWGPNHWPHATPAWERGADGVLGSSWLRTFWDMTTMPRFFFQRLPLGRRSLAGILFALPIILAGGFFAACHLPVVVASYPETTEGLVTLVFSETGLGDGTTGYGNWVRSVQMVLSVLVFWALVVGSVATLLQVGARITFGLRASWFDILKVAGYTLSPLILMFLLQVASNYILAVPEMGYGLAGQPLARFADDILRSVTGFAAVIWPYFLTLTALEETLRLSRLRAQTVILSSVVLGMFCLVLIKAI